MKELNPHFDALVEPTIENEVIKESFKFNTDDETDISPVRAFSRLRAVRCIRSSLETATVP